MTDRQLPVTNHNQIQNRYSIFLDGINPVQIETKYGLQYIDLDKFDRKSTPLFEETVNNPFMDFDDVIRRKKQWLVVMNDFMSREQISTNYKGRCYYHHGTFDSVPIGCPIEYVQAQVVTKKQGREIDRYRLQYGQKVTLNQEQELIPDSYVTMHVFCSPSCVASFYDLNRNNLFNNYKYHLKNSMQLLRCLYFDMTGKQLPDVIPRAHPYTVQKDYGGILTKEQYEESWKTMIVKSTELLVKRRIQNPVGQALEVTSKFC